MQNILNSLNDIETGICNTFHYVKDAILEKIDFIAAAVFRTVYSWVSEEKSHEITLLSQAIHEIEDLSLNVEEMDHLEAVQKLIPCYITGYTATPADIQQAIQNKQQQLLSALKTHYCTVKGIWEGVTSNPELIKEKSDLARLCDIQRAQLHPSVRSIPPTLLNLKKGNVNPEWKQPGNSLTAFPPYLFYFPHAVGGSDEPNNITHEIVADDKVVMYYNTNDPWAKTLDFAEQTYLSHPLKDLNVEELKKMMIELHQWMVNSPEDSVRQEELLVFKTGEWANINQLIQKYKRQNDNITSQSFEEIKSLFQRWGAMEISRDYYLSRHWAAWNKTAYVTVPPETIDELLTQFFTQLKEHLNSNLHPYQVAAFIHFGLTAIHPYGDANGRLARLFMNIYLAQHGYPSYIAFSEELYTKAANASYEEYEDLFTRELHQFQSQSLEQNSKEDWFPTIKNGKKWNTTGNDFFDQFLGGDDQCTVQ